MWDRTDVYRYPEKSSDADIKTLALSKGKCHSWSDNADATNSIIKVHIMKNAVSHMRILPHPLLRKHIAHYTFHLPSAVEHYASKLIPDASGSIAFLFLEEGLQLQLWGPSSQIFHAPVHGQSPLCLFIDFRPAGMHSLLKFLSLCDVNNQNVPLALVDKQIATKLAYAIGRHTFLYATPTPFALSLTEAIARSIPDLPALTNALDTIFLQRFTSTSKTSIVSSLLHFIRSGSGVTRVKEAASCLGYSSRHLNRLCLQQVGLSAKSFFRVARINLASEALKEHRSSLAELSLELGYYDQSHFIHDFSDICGVTPAQYLCNTFDFYGEPQELLLSV